MEVVKSALKTETLTVNMGPQHPSTHGVFRMIVTLDGETIVDLVPVMGYLHRCHEKIGERNTYLQNIPYTDRLDYICSMSNNLAYVMAVEKLAGIEVPERAEYIRIIMVELTRVLNHAVAIGALLNDLGCFFTPMLYSLREREKILDLFEMASGSRMMCNYMRFGGVRYDLPPEFMPELRELLSILSAFIDEFERLLTENEIVLARCRGVGVLPPEKAVAYSCTGPLLRASGVDYDIRKLDSYSIYDRFHFQVPLGENGDVYDRYLVRVEEMRQSTRIVQQAVEEMPEGDFCARLPRVFKPPQGDVYHRIESPKGELGFYLVSDGSTNPYRYKVRSPTFINLTVLPELCKGHKVADVVAILGSIDIVLGEVDR